MAGNTFLFANNANSTLSQPLTPSATAVTLATGGGELFPNPGSGQQFSLTLNDAATGLLYEIAYCTARSGDVLTVERAQEGTTALPWLVGDFASNLVTAGTQASFVQAAAVPRSFVGTAAPLTGTWLQGDQMWNPDVIAGGSPGWVCTTPGTPGIWTAMANLA